MEGVFLFHSFRKSPYCEGVLLFGIELNAISMNYFEDASFILKLKLIKSMAVLLVGLVTYIVFMHKPFNWRNFMKSIDSGYYS